MKSSITVEKRKNCILIFLLLVVNFVLFSVFFDFYYDLNDDVLMKDIMSGVYTGTPDGHNMQTLYVLGAFISFCYRLCRSIPWYGLFLYLCQAGSLYLIGVRLLQFCKKAVGKIAVMLLFSAFLWGIMLSHLIAVQYTVTAALMASAAIFLFLTTPKGLSVKQFIKENIPSIVLVILAYQLRTEMLLLVFPLICLAGLFRWLEEEHFFKKENYQKYGITIGIILIGMLVSRMVDFAAYGNEEWQRFLTFFEKRTEVYDYHYEVLTSGEYAEDLTALGLSSMQQELLANYNFGLDESLDERVLTRIADYAKENTIDTEISKERILEKIKLYLYQIRHPADAAYQGMILLAYCLAFFVGMYQIFAWKKEKKRWHLVIELFLLVGFRTILWLYLLLMGRTPVRITHSLYLAEAAVLFGVLIVQLVQLEEKRKQSEKTKEKQTIKQTGRPISACLCSVLFLLFAFCLPQSIKTTLQDKAIREENNAAELAIAGYTKAHAENFYLEDVYSTVGFSQKIFTGRDNQLANYDMMGGWICKSPLSQTKLFQYGITNIEEALLNRENVFFLAQTDTDTSWLPAYYSEKGITVQLEQIEEICEGYGVYQLKIQK